MTVFKETFITVMRNFTMVFRMSCDLDRVLNERYLAKLNDVCEDINDNLGAEGLRRGFLARIEKLVACKGGRLSE